MEHRKIRMPRILYEVFGMEQKQGDLLALGLFALVATTAIAFLTRATWGAIVWWKTALLFLFFLDITAGVVANFTRGTNDYYAARPRLRVMFLLVHVQPLIVAWLLSDGYPEVLFAWGYTIVASFVVNAFAHHPAQPIAGVVALSFGWILLLFLAPQMPLLLTALLGLFMLKLIYAFAVDHFEFRGILP